MSLYARMPCLKQRIWNCSVKTIRTCQPQPSSAGASSASRSAKVDGMLFMNKKEEVVAGQWHPLSESQMPMTTGKAPRFMGIHQGTKPVLVWADILAGCALWVMMPYTTDVWKLDYTHAAAIVNFFTGAASIMPIRMAFFVNAFMGDYLMLLLSGLAFSFIEEDWNDLMKRLLLTEEEKDDIDVTEAVQKMGQVED
ncbi:hypothetical protein L1049_014971 [Liquidambar formosana]|uniref:Uncharacterized protein n=1 Tax=Liquidambar formosana TaxID=63359 RepID=A0AAP0RXC7_LIQFO